MAKFRKKPVVIEAEQYDGSLESVNKILKLDKWDTNSIVLSDKCLTINTLEGKMRADIGDWIIKGVQGELYPCKPDIFEATYEPVEEN